ncbi:MAG TPA: hypothetical protein VNB23_12750 [Ramlibacter sp.]|nr:hypothetical protein [Ramlibacter sp.]
MSAVLAAAVVCMAMLHGTPVHAQQGGESLRTAKIADLGPEAASPEVRHLADWAVHSRDPAGLPFAVVDKVQGRLYVFDAQGRLLGASAALVGSAPGDTSVPGIGDRQISSIRPEERTTPAGRFEARMGLGPKGEDILWVDYQNALALHRVVTNVPQERRLQRLASQVASDRRITYGCINVPAAFYDSVVRPAFSAGGGVVYILPEQRRAQELFGSYDVGDPRVVQASSTPVSQRP